eukprot:1142398-Rhodomonas_salina.1
MLVLGSCSPFATKYNGYPGRLGSVVGRFVLPLLWATVQAYLHEKERSAFTQTLGGPSAKARRR